MSSSDIGQSPGFNTQSAGSYPINQPNSQDTETQQVSNGSYFNSSIGISDQELLILLINPGLAILPQPIVDNSSPTETAKSDVIGSIESTKAKIINSMWQTFAQGIEEIAKIAKEEAREQAIKADRIRGEDIKHDYLKQQIMKSVTHPESSNSAISQLHAQFDHTFAAWLNPGLGANMAVSSSLYPSVGFIAGATAISVDVIRNAVGEVGREIGSQLSVSPVADALQGAGPSSGLPGDYQAAAALVAAILYNGSVFRATYDTIEEANKAKAPPQDLQFALNYAKNIIAIVTFNIEQNQATTPTPNEAKQNRLMRLMLSVMALNMVYRLTYGGMTGQEFIALLKGDTSNLRPDVKPILTQLSGLINSFLPLGTAEREQAINDLAAYIDNKNPIDEMLKTTSIFTTLLKSRAAIAQGVSGAVTQ